MQMGWMKHDEDVSIILFSLNEHLIAKVYENVEKWLYSHFKPRTPMITAIINRIGRATMRAIFYFSEM